MLKKCEPIARLPLLYFNNYVANITEFFYIYTIEKVIDKTTLQIIFYLVKCLSDTNQHFLIYWILTINILNVSHVYINIVNIPRYTNKSITPFSVTSVPLEV